MVGIRDAHSLLIEIQHAKSQRADVVVNSVQAKAEGGPLVQVGRRARWKSRVLNTLTLGASNYYKNWRLLNAMKTLLDTPQNRPLQLGARSAALRPRDMNPSSTVFASLIQQSGARNQPAARQPSAALHPPMVHPPMVEPMLENAPSLTRTAPSVPSSVHDAEEPGPALASRSVHEAEEPSSLKRAPSTASLTSLTSLASLGADSLYSPPAQELLEKFLGLKQDLIQSPPTTLAELNQHTENYHGLVEELRTFSETATSPGDQRTLAEIDGAMEYWLDHASENVPQSEFDAAQAAPTAPPSPPQARAPAPPAAPPPAPPAAPPSPPQARAPAPPAAPPPAPPAASTATQPGVLERALAQGRNFQLIERGTPETIPLLNKTPTPRAGKGATYYLERQQRMFCGKHALNAMFGDQVISKKDYVDRMHNNIIEFLGSRELAQESGMLGDSGLSSADQIIVVLGQLKDEGKIQLPDAVHNQYFEGGRNIGAAQVTQLSQALDDYAGDRLIAGNSAHWVALRRDDAGQWWELDSMKSAPEPFQPQQYLEEAGGNVNFITFGEALGI